MKFTNLISVISETHSHLQAEAAKSVNRLLTARNWLIGFYIVEYEQKGEDRAKYGENLLKAIEDHISNQNNFSINQRRLREFRQFYLAYPQIWRTLSAKLSGKTNTPFLQTTSGEFGSALEVRIQDHSELPSELEVPPKELVTRLNFSHFLELMKVEEPLKRTFYEISCIKGSWSVRAAGMDENIFIQKYLIQLPDKKRLETFIQNELKRL